MGNKPALAIEGGFPWFGLYIYIAPIRLQFAGVDRIIQVGLQDMLANGYAQEGVFDGKECFDPVIEIALHHVGASQVDLRVPVIAKVEDAAVLQETPHNASNANIVANARKTRAQAAYTTDDQA